MVWSDALVISIVHFASLINTDSLSRQIFKYVSGYVHRSVIGCSKNATVWKLRINIDQMTFIKAIPIVPTANLLMISHIHPNTGAYYLERNSCHLQRWKLLPVYNF